eukprot:2558186-Rhodomonas_salina.2
MASFSADDDSPLMSKRGEGRERRTAVWGLTRGATSRHGSVDQLPFQTMGSGSLCAMAVFENGYQDNLEQDNVRAG